MNLSRIKILSKGKRSRDSTAFQCQSPKRCRSHRNRLRIRTGLPSRHNLPTRLRVSLFGQRRLTNRARDARGYAGVRQPQVLQNESSRTRGDMLGLEGPPRLRSPGEQPGLSR